MKLKAKGKERNRGIEIKYPKEEPKKEDKELLIKEGGERNHRNQIPKNLIGKFDYWESIINIEKKGIEKAENPTLTKLIIKDLKKSVIKDIIWCLIWIPIIAIIALIIIIA